MPRSASVPPVPALDIMALLLVLFQCILEELVDSLPLARVLRLRLINKFFDHEIVRCVLINQGRGGNELLDHHVPSLEAQCKGVSVPSDTGLLKKLYHFWVRLPIRGPGDWVAQTVHDTIGFVEEVKGPLSQSERSRFVERLATVTADDRYMCRKRESQFITMVNVEKGDDFKPRTPGNRKLCALIAVAAIGDVDAAEEIMRSDIGLSSTELPPSLKEDEHTGRYCQEEGSWKWALFRHALRCAARYAHHKLFRLLFQHYNGPEYVFWSRRGAEKLIIEAASSGNMEVVKVMTAGIAHFRYRFWEHTFSPDALLYDGSPEAKEACIGAAANGHCEVVSFLWKRLDLDPKGEVAGKILLAACQQGRPKVVQMMLDKGVPVGVRGEWIDRKTYMALEFASMKGHVAVVRQLLEAGANTFSHELDRLLRGAGLESSLASLRKVVAERKLRHIYVPLQFGQRPFPAVSLAIRRGHVGVLQAFLDTIHDANESDGDLLCEAARYDEVPILRCLLKNGLNLAASNVVGRVMNEAARKGSAGLIQALVDHGISPDAIEESGDQHSCNVGKRALVVATKARHEPVVQLLESLDARPLEAESGSGSVVTC